MTVNCDSRLIVAWNSVFPQRHHRPFGLNNGCAEKQPLASGYAPFMRQPKRLIHFWIFIFFGGERGTGL